MIFVFVVETLEWSILLALLFLLIIVFILLLLLLVHFLGNCTLSLVFLALWSIWSSGLFTRALSEPLRKSRFGSLVPFVQFLLVLRFQHFCPDPLPASLVESLPVCVGARVSPPLVLGEHPDSRRILPGESFRVEAFLGCFLSQLNLLSFLELLQFVVLIYAALFT